MAKPDDKAGLPLSQTKLTTDQQQALTEPLSKLEDQLHNLLASYRFYDCAIRHMTEPDHFEESDDWHFGLFLHQQYLQQQADKVMEELVNIKRLIH
jgi:dTDP-4-amino-4,6-dideoxygalactose transaminase